MVYFWYNLILAIIFFTDMSNPDTNDHEVPYAGQSPSVAAALNLPEAKSEASDVRGEIHSQLDLQTDIAEGTEFLVDDIDEFVTKLGQCFSTEHGLGGDSKYYEGGISRGLLPEARFVSGANDKSDRSTKSAEKYRVKIVPVPEEVLAEDTFVAGVAFTVTAEVAARYPGLAGYVKKDKKLSFLLFVSKLKMGGSTTDRNYLNIRILDRARNRNKSDIDDAEAAVRASAAIWAKAKLNGLLHTFRGGASGLGSPVNMKRVNQ